MAHVDRRDGRCLDWLGYLSGPVKDAAEVDMHDPLDIPDYVLSAMAHCQAQSPPWYYQYGNWVCAVNGFVERVSDQMGNRDAVFMKLYRLAIAAAGAEEEPWPAPTPG